MAFSPKQLRSIEIVERSTSVLSIAGSLFIITTFTFFPYFRKPINRLVFLASTGNLLCNLATLISISGWAYGDHSALCNFQAFLIQMFIPADSLWTFCMALNVYLTFFRSYEATNLRDLEKWYFLVCYGLPLLPALIFLCISASEKAHIYGPATLWCWIAVEWDWMRIVFFYGPVWIIIVVTMAIYLLTGKEIFKQRAALRAFSRDEPPEPDMFLDNPFTRDNTDITKVTEIKVTTETVPTRVEEEELGVSPSTDGRSSFSSTRKLSTTMPELPARSRSTRQDASAWPYQANATDAMPLGPQMVSKLSTTVTGGVSPKIAAATTRSQKRPRPAARQASRAAWGYAKVSMLMFAAMIIVWVPSTINRVYSLVQPEHPSFACSFLAGLVLPLQGFWNAMIYVSTSWSQCKMAWHDTFASRTQLTRLGSDNDRIGTTSHGSNPLHSSQGAKNFALRDINTTRER